MTSSTQPILDWLEPRIRQHLPYDAGEDIALSVIDEQHRAACSLLFLRASSRAHSLEMVAKIPQGGDEAPVDDRRPRCFPILNSKHRSRYEHAALQASAGHFCHLQDSRFGFLQPLAYEPESGTIVTRRVFEPTLRHQFLKSHRLRFWQSSRNLCRASEHAGAWLREFHRLKNLETQPRFTEAAEVEDMCGQLCQFLKQRGGSARFLDDVRDDLRRKSSGLRKSPLTLGPCHGDFAPRNIFVDSTQRVTACDPLGMWQAPIYQDIGEFLANVKASGLQCVSLQLAHSRNQIAECERAFLRGYFTNEQVPLKLVRLFEVHATLAKWASSMNRSATGILQRVRQRAFRRLVEDGLRELASVKEGAVA